MIVMKRISIMTGKVAFQVIVVHQRLREIMPDRSRLEGSEGDFKNTKLMEWMNTFCIWTCWEEIYTNRETLGGELYVEK